MKRNEKRMQALIQRREELKQIGIRGWDTELRVLSENIRGNSTVSEEALARFAFLLNELEDVAIDLDTMLENKHENKRLLYAEREDDPDETHCLLLYLIAGLADIKKGFADEDPEEDEKFDQEQANYARMMNGELPTNDEVIDQETKIKGFASNVGVFEGYVKTTLTRSRLYSGTVLLSSPPQLQGRTLTLPEISNVRYIEKSTHLIVALEKMYRFEVYISPDWTCEALMRLVLGLALQEVKNSALSFDHRKLKNIFLWKLMLSNQEAIPREEVLRTYLWKNAGDLLFLVSA